MLSAGQVVLSVVVPARSCVDPARYEGNMAPVAPIGSGQTAARKEGLECGRGPLAVEWLVLQVQDTWTSEGKAAKATYHVQNSLSKA